MGKSKGQIGIYVIAAVVIVALIGGYFLFRNSLSSSNVPEELKPVYDYYDQCITQETQNALDLAGSQGGKLDVGTYVPGSDYAPFASHLNFFGFPVPYWYYVAGNGIVKEQVPTLSESEQEIGEYLNTRIRNCDFSDFERQGYDISLGDVNTNVKISDTQASVKADAELVVSRNNVTARVTSRSLEVVSSYGALFKQAIDLYNKEKSTAFLENYSLDVLRLYAPVDGVEIQCSPKVWKSREVVKTVQDALEGNIQALKFENNRPSGSHGYFVVQTDGTADIRALYSESWPFKMEIYGADGELMIAEPAGNQQGLGVTGFCYVPYHYVYDMSFPVLFQLSSGDEVFQFPVAVVIDKNMPRNGIQTESLAGNQSNVDICASANQEVTVNVFNTDLQNVDANLNYHCFDQRCPLGNTEQGKWSGLVPTCLNGYIEAKADGYQTKQQVFSTNKETQSDLILDRSYPVKVKVTLDGKELQGNALVTFAGIDSKSAMLPDSNSIMLSEGLYNVTVYVYGNSTITIPASSRQECRTVTDSGILGFFGGTKDECFNIDLPETKVDYALMGGGVAKDVYLFPSQLSGGTLTINGEALPAPTNLQDLQNNYASFDVLIADVQI